MQNFGSQNIEQQIVAAWEHIQQDKLGDAMLLAKQAFTLAPESPEVAHLLGLIASREGQHQIALTQLQKALDLGGYTVRRLRDMAEALYSAGYPEAALTPLNDAISSYGASSALLGLKSAIEIALERLQEAEQSALEAIALEPNLLAWELNVSFTQLIQLNLVSGFKYATARTENLHENSRCPAMYKVTPCDVWLHGEQGIGDTLFYLRYVPGLKALGWQFHLQADRKLVPLLESTGLFRSVKESNKCPSDCFWMNVGDLALMAQQCGIEQIPEPLVLRADPKQVEKIRKELEKIGPAPYIAVTWRGGPKGRKQRAGLRMLEKTISPAQLGAALSGFKGTIVNIQRLPVLEETLAFHQALGHKTADYTALNNNLSGMLALLSVVDDYITVSNTNLHLRESVGKTSKVFVNRPFQDWRWLTQGEQTPWYPRSKVLRQDRDGNWQSALDLLHAQLLDMQGVSAAATIDNEDMRALGTSLHQDLIVQGWQALAEEQLPLAIQKAQQILQDNPKHAGAHHLLGWAAVSDFKFEIAIGILQQACMLAPDNGIYVRDFVRALALSGNPQQALVVADAALSDPGLNSKSSIHYAKAAICATQGDYPSALAHYDACLQINPNYMDALDFGGMLRMKLGANHARLGFKQNSARKQCQHPSQIDIYCCPVLKGNIQGLKLLIARDMGLGDELTYLRYLPWLVKAGADITYWCGAKLLPMLARQDLGIHLIPDSQPRPDPSQFDLAFIVSELSYAGEHLGAPEIAPPLPLSPNPELVEKWRQWLSRQGAAPYIGFNWRAGVANTEKMASITKLSKAIEPQLLAQSLSKVHGTFISLQRNVTQQALEDFASQLQSPVADASALTDGVEDLLALLSLLDANVGVSNTNMHLRAGLGKASDVLVQNPGGDWRWGVEGSHSAWFPDCTVYRQSLDGSWQAALQHLQSNLQSRYGVASAIKQGIMAAKPTTALLSKKIIWVTAGEIKIAGSEVSSILESARQRVIGPAQGLEQIGWRSSYINESIAEVMGGWNGQNPQQGDIVIFSKVMTAHAVTMIEDAQARGAFTIVDVFNDFSSQPKRAQLQQAMMARADAVVSIALLSQLWQQHSIDAYIEDITPNLNIDETRAIVQQWHELLSALPHIKDKTNQNQYCQSAVSLASAQQKRVLVGMLYSGEQEFEQARQALAGQSHCAYECVEIKHLPNKQAHDALYEHFMSRSQEFDYFLKLDADMVFAHERVLEEMVATMEKCGCAHLMAYVKDSPSGLMIPGIQMFRSDTRWDGSEELLNVDYFPKLTGDSHYETAQNWVLHMPLPSHEQLFRYGIHKALKATQPHLAPAERNQRKAILHMNILAGIARNSVDQPDLRWTLMGATLVFDGQFKGVVYSGETTREHLEKLQSPDYFAKLDALSRDMWQNEIQMYYRWLELFGKPAQVTAITPQPQPEAIQSAPVNRSKTQHDSKQKRLIWITAGQLEQGPGIITSALASTRYRVLLPAANLGVLGWQSQIINESDLITHGWQNFQLMSEDVLIVSKSLQPAILSAIQQAKQLGCQIVVDYCDNHFERPDVGPHQHQLLHLANQIVCSTPELETYISGLGAARVVHISDCFEGSRQPALFQPADTLKLLWFGNSTNFDTLAPLLQQLVAFAESKPIQLNIVTLHAQGAQAAKNASQGRLEVIYTPWSGEALKAALAHCDMVVIPTLQADYKAGKSPNRLIESLWAGRYVVAGCLPAYAPFAQFASVGDDLVAGIQWALNNPEAVLHKIQQGQAYIIEHHTPKRISEQWHAVLSSLPAATQQEQVPLSAYLQLQEVNRILGLQLASHAEAVAAYEAHYPPLQDVQFAKVAVYTAIFGNYDTPPVLHYTDPALDYILYTDQQDCVAPAPWQVRVVPAAFVDPQMDARRIKVLSHLFLHDYDVSVWVDGNFTVETLSRDFIIDMVNRAPVALCRHQFRNCIFDEAVEIMSRQLDAATPVLNQIQYYQARQFPAQLGLHATGFMVRNHRDQHTLKMNMRWWELLSTFSKRDQLSFDYVRWEQCVPVMSLPFNLRDNTLYFWGKNGQRSHLGSNRRNDEHMGRQLAAQHCITLPEHRQHYEAVYDSWHQGFLSELHVLNAVLVKHAPIQPSLLYASAEAISPSSLPDPRLGHLQRMLLAKIMQSKRILQLGFDGGHFALTVLYHSGAKCVVADSQISGYMQSGTDYLAERHPKRFARAALDDILQLDLHVFDLVLVTQQILEDQPQLKTLLDKLGTQKCVTLTACLPVTSTPRRLPADTSDYTQSVYGVWLKNRKQDNTWRFAVQGKYGHFYADFIKQLEAGLFIDIGANIGLYSLLADKNPHITAIYSFEPHPVTYPYLLDNLRMNQTTRCLPYSLAISDKNTTQTIYSKPNHSGVATLRAVSQSEGFQESISIQTIDAQALDALIQNESRLPIHIKIDVEGYELIVMQTLAQTALWSQVASVYYEVDEAYLDYAAIARLLTDAGFVFKHQNGIGSHYDLLYVRE